jgi:hypothetical protein
MTKQYNNAYPYLEIFAKKFPCKLFGRNDVLNKNFGTSRGFHTTEEKFQNFNTPPPTKIFP